MKPEYYSIYRCYLTDREPRKIVEKLTEKQARAKLRSKNGLYYHLVAFPLNYEPSNTTAAILIHLWKNLGQSKGILIKNGTSSHPTKGGYDVKTQFQPQQP